jgi:two-component system, NarL family, nitrate/nitrite response regulator NarL
MTLPRFYAATKTGLNKGAIAVTETSDLIRIAVFDADGMFGLGICALLNQREDFAATSYKPDTLISEIDFALDAPYDVALIDPGQIDVSATELAKTMHDRFGAVGLVCYCSDDMLAAARGWLAAGFAGFLPKSAGLPALQSTIASVHAGSICVDPRVVSALNGETIGRSPHDDKMLTDREKFVLKSVAHGKSLKEIAHELAVSAKTVETYKARGSKKMNLQGRRSIVEFAIRRGWVQ